MIRVLFVFSLLAISCHIKKSSQTTVSTESRLIKLEKLAVADTTLVQVRGRVIDFDDNGPLSGATVLFTRVSENMILGALTDQEGRFEKKFKPETYNIEVRYTGKTEFFAGNIAFESGGVYDLQIGMASMSATGK